MTAEPKRRQSGSAKDVASRAGVSVTTVSRVLNGRADAISPETQRRVVAAATALGYRPNSLAIALRRGVTETIGLVVPDVSDGYFHQIARGVEDVAQPVGYGVLLTNTDRIPDREAAVVNMLLDKRVDGIIFAGGGVDGDAHLRELAWGSARVVTIGPHDLDFPSVRVDDEAAIEAGVNHLASIGCRRVLCLAGEPDWLVSRQRLTGYHRAVTAHRLAKDQRLVMHGQFSRESAEKRIHDALAAGVRFDSVVAFNDYCAIGAMQALADAGLKVPDDVAVIGCDDIAEAELVQPSLSSISFSQYQMGRAAAAVLLGLPEADDFPTIHPHTVTIRQSTAKAAHIPKRKSPRRA